MTLYSDAIFGNGLSVPGGEDISVLTDKEGFPYYKASSLKGIFREELSNYLYWEGNTTKQVNDILEEKMGVSGDDRLDDQTKIRFTNFVLSDAVKEQVKNEIGENPDRILRAFSYLRTFTALAENGMTKKGSLRECRCLKKGLIFYGMMKFDNKDKKLVLDTLSCIKWIGTMRTRGFGQVKLEVI